MKQTDDTHKILKKPLINRTYNKKTFSGSTHHIKNSMQTSTYFIQMWEKYSLFPPLKAGNIHKQRCDQWGRAYKSLRRFPTRSVQISSASRQHSYTLYLCVLQYCEKHFCFPEMRLFSYLTVIARLNRLKLHQESWRNMWLGIALGHWV